MARPKKVRRGRPPLSAAEKARRAKEREEMKASGKAPSAKRGRPAKEVSSALKKLDVSSVVTFANHLIRHEQDISIALKGTQNVADWANNTAKQLNELFPKFAEVVANIDKLLGVCVELETRLQKIENAIDFGEETKPRKAKKALKNDGIPNGEVHSSEPSN